MLVELLEKLLKAVKLVHGRHNMIFKISMFLASVYIWAPNSSIFILNSSNLQFLDGEKTF